MYVFRPLLVVAFWFCTVAHAAAAPTPADSACGVRDGVVLNGPRNSHDVALTFDACPTLHVPGFAPAIVDSLKQHDVAATFFVSGRWAEKHRDAFATLVGVPTFDVALHSQFHRHLRGASAQNIRAEIENGRATLQRLGATPQPFFRPPFGETPPPLPIAARAAGVTPVLWDVAPGDPSPDTTAKRIARYVLQNVRGGSIIVLHVNGRGVGTEAAVPAIVDGLRARGFTFVTVSTLLRTCTAPQPEHPDHPQAENGKWPQMHTDEHRYGPEGTRESSPQFLRGAGTASPISLSRIDFESVFIGVHPWPFLPELETPALLPEATP